MSALRKQKWLKPGFIATLAALMCVSAILCLMFGDDFVTWAIELSKPIAELTEVGR